MTCDEGRELVQRSVDNDLDSQETALMNEHLRTCPDCSALFDRLTLLSSNLAELPRVTPPFSLVDAILPRLELIDAGNGGAAQAAGYAADYAEQAPVAGSVDAAAAESAQAPLAAPAAGDELARRRRNRSTTRRILAAIAAGIVAGLVIVAAPTLLHDSSSDNDSFALSEAPAAKQRAASESSAAGEPASGYEMAAPSSESGEVAPQAMEEPLRANSSSADSGSASAGEGDAKASSSADEPEQLQGLAFGSAIPSASPSPSAGSAETNKALGAGEAAGGSADQGLTAGDQSESLGDTVTGSIMSVPFAEPLTWISPDQKLKAVAEEHRVSVYRMEDGTLVFQSVLHDGEELSSIYWEQDSSALRYSWKAEDGSFTDLVWTVSTNAESPAGTNSAQSSASAK
ncbi:anti-sigma factor family protein [Cohnella fermenti]|uniref:Anti-sigma-W factor RsiW n=1 Tax=Cohnella fermenti TaxID=2565925 RepID=A0A4S4BJZ4_9BACL|nr:zf-HC2 domain-containing protein [Cohnella fermenti]THF75020.1 zf-HC2 domain-containing protein [Cohnella fermenti]